MLKTFLIWLERDFYLNILKSAILSVLITLYLLFNLFLLILFLERKTTDLEQE